MKLRTLYPPLEPAVEGWLEVPGGHRLYYEESGHRHGKPVLFLHGGPGGGTDPNHRRLFDPRAYRIVLMDQRGAGRSHPLASIENNTTWDLVEDIERLRRHLGIERWQIFGGSWGSTLGLAYAQTHPDHVSELILRGIFLLRPAEIDWFFRYGTNQLFPEAWERFLEPIPPAERDDLLQAYYRRLTSDDQRVRLSAARAWSVWEATTSSLLQQPERIEAFSRESTALAMARIECHYFVNDGFFERPDQLIENIGRIRHIPGVIVQGRYDVICPPVSAWELKRAWPEADLRIVPDAGHAYDEPGIVHELISATDRFGQST